MKKREEKKEKEKTPVQRFFDQVKLFDVGADWGAVEAIFNKKNDILNNFAKNIISEIDKAVELMGDDCGNLIRREICLGFSPEEPSPEADLAIRHLEITFLKELEHVGVVKNLKEVRKEDEESQRLLDYVVISFYPKELKEYLQENKGAINSGRQNGTYNKNINPSDFYIVKYRDDFKYNGILLEKIGKDTDYYIVFDVIYTLVPYAGFATYEKIGNEVKNRIRKTAMFSPSQMTKFIQTKLDRHNGFLHYAKGVPCIVTGGKKLFEPIRERGIYFNNRKGG